MLSGYNPFGEFFQARLYAFYAEDNGIPNFAVGFLRQINRSVWPIEACERLHQLKQCLC
jgi:hypothetical protein